MEPGIKFDAATHTYTVGPLTYPSVTQILENVGLIDKSWYSEADADRGRKRHKAIQLCDAGELDFDSIDEETTMFVMAWEQYKQDRKIKVLESEYVFAHQFYKYAGTIDKILVENGVQHIVDIKTGQFQRWHEIQCVGYYDGLTNYFGSPYKHQPLHCDIVYLDKKGGYKAIGADVMGQRKVWESCLNLYQWKHK